ncbi:ribbon-helix-helix protein, CopG family [Phyllobacterium brassicacearum]|uniref:ribbon-helix-helix protein, CopG family n=2 Tax=Phyllobacterium brassicacearum TaxID=314235 RepID=UPI00106122FE|nr:ribbon-helix-helix CopG family protein [Phyllobacterium brassicacearum]
MGDMIVSIRIDRTTGKKLKELAMAEDRSLNYYVKRLIREHLEETSKARVAVLHANRNI